MFGKKSQRERRKFERRPFPHYMQFKNDQTGELVGDLADISLNGFRLEGTRPIPLNEQLQFRVDVPPEIHGKASIVITARSRWISPHPIDPRLYIMGYEMIHADPVDSDLYRSIHDQFGRSGAAKKPAYDYVWKN